MFTFAILDSSIFILAIFLIGSLAVVSSFAANEKGLSSTITIVGILLALQFLTDNYKPFNFAYGHPLETIGIIAAYLGAGVVYLYVRWRWFFIKDAKAAYTAFAANPAKFEYAYVGTLSPSKIDEAFVSYAGRKVGVKRFPIKVSDYKEMLYCWNFYWPLLIAHSILKDPLRLVRERIGKTLQNVADSAFQQ